MPSYTPHWFLTGGQPDQPTPQNGDSLAASLGGTAPQRDLASLLSDPKFVSGSADRRREMAKEFEKTDLPNLVRQHNLSDTDAAAVRRRAREVLKPLTAKPKDRNAFFDNDWFDSAHAGAAGAGASILRMFDPYSPTAEKFDAYAEGIKRDNFTGATRDTLLRDQELRQEAQESGGDLSEAWQVAKNFARSPGLYTSQAAGSSAVPLAAGALATTLTAGLGPAIATGAGLAAGAIGGAATEFGAARGETAKLAMTLPYETLRLNPEIDALANAGVPEEEVRRLAGEAINRGHLIATAGGALEGSFLGKLPGIGAGAGLVAKGLGRATGGRLAAGTRTMGAVEGLATEAASGATSQIGTNIASQPLNPKIGTFDGALPAAVEEGLPGMAMGGIRNGSVRPPTSPPSPPPSQTPALPAPEPMLALPAPETPPPDTDVFGAVDTLEPPEEPSDPLLLPNAPTAPLVVDQQGTAAAPDLMVDGVPQNTTLNAQTREARAAQRQVAREVAESVEQGTGEVQEALAAAEQQGVAQPMQLGAMATMEDVARVRQQVEDSWFAENVPPVTDEAHAVAQRELQALTNDVASSLATNRDADPSTEFWKAYGEWASRNPEAASAVAESLPALQQDVQEMADYTRSLHQIAERWDTEAVTTTDNRNDNGAQTQNPQDNDGDGPGSPAAPPGGASGAAGTGTNPETKRVARRTPRSAANPAPAENDGAQRGSIDPITPPAETGVPEGTRTTPTKRGGRATREGEAQGAGQRGAADTGAATRGRSREQGGVGENEAVAPAPTPAPKPKKLASKKEAPKTKRLTSKKSPAPAPESTPTPAPTPAPAKRLEAKKPPVEDGAAITRKQKADAETAWEEAYGAAPDGTEVAYSDLNEAAKDRWVIAHRDPELTNEALDDTAQSIIRGHTRNAAAERVNARASENAAAEKAAMAQVAEKPSTTKRKRPKGEVPTIDPDGVFSTQRGPGGRGMSLRFAKYILDKIIAVMPVAKNIVVVQDMTDPRVSMFATGTEIDQKRMGLRTADGKVYVIAGNIPSVTEFYLTVVHELLHKGLQSLYKTQAAYLEDMKKWGKDPEVRRRAEAWKISEDGVLQRSKLSDPMYEALAVEEALAEIAETLEGGTLAGSSRSAWARRFAVWLGSVLDRAGAKMLGDAARSMTRTKVEKFVYTALMNADTEFSGYADQNSTTPTDVHRTAFDAAKGFASAVMGRIPAAQRQAIDRMFRESRPAGTLGELWTELDTGRDTGHARTLSGITTALFDYAQPMLDWLGGNRKHKLWQQFFTSENTVNRAIAHSSDVYSRDVLDPIARTARKMGETYHDFSRAVGAYATARWAPIGNAELKAQHEADAAEALEVIERVGPTVEDGGGTPTEKKEFKEATAQLKKARAWLDRFDEANGTVRHLNNDVRDDDAFTGGMTDAEAEQTIGKLRQKYGDNFEKVVEAADRVTKFMRNQRDEYVKGISKERLKRMKEEGVAGNTTLEDLIALEMQNYSESPHYVPTTGVTGENAENETALVLPSSGVKSLKDFVREGRSSLSGNPLAEVAQRAAAMHRRLHMFPLLRELERQSRVDGNPLQIGVVGLGAPVSGRSIPYTVAIRQQTKNGPKLVIHHHRITIANQAALEAMLGLNRAAARPGAFLRNTFRRYTGGFGWMVTRMVPTFAPINSWRDTFERVANLVANSGEKISPAKLAASAGGFFADMSGLRAAMRTVALEKGADLFAGVENSEAMKAAREIDAETGFMTRTAQLVYEMDDVANRMAKQVGSPGMRTKIKRGLDNWAEAWERHAQISVYRAVRAQGFPPQQAARMTLEAMNLNRVGTHAGMMQTFYPFFGARMAGSQQVLRMTRTARGWGTIVGTILAGTALYAMSAAMGGEEEDDEGLTGDRQDSISGMSISRVMPLWLGGSDFIKVPIPYGVPMIGWNVGVALNRVANGTWTPKQAVEHVAVAVVDETSPITPHAADMSESFGWGVAKGLTPELFQRLLNVVAQRNDFGGPLGKPNYDRERPYSAQGLNRTPQVWHTIAREVALKTAGMIDATPEVYQEFAKMFVPTAQQASKMYEDSAEDSDTGGLMALGATALGLPRLKGKNDRTRQAIYHERVKDAQNAMKSVELELGKRPKAARGQRAATIADWVSASSLPAEKQTLVEAYINADIALRKARDAHSKDGGDLKDWQEREREIQLDFLREIAQ